MNGCCKREKVHLSKLNYWQFRSNFNISFHAKKQLKNPAFEREEIPEIPVAVIREIFANSFAHAKYDGNTTHKICIHPGMITIYNPGPFKCHSLLAFARFHLHWTLLLRRGKEV